MSSFDIDSLKKYADNLEKKLKEIPQLKELQKKIGVPLVPVILGLIVLLIIIIFFFSGLKPITSIVAFVYPAYRSIIAINTANKDDDTLWLSYWVFYGLFVTFESVLDMILFWIPFYEIIKMGIYLYLYLPETNGALVLYVQLIKPFATKLQLYEDKVKSNISNAYNNFNSNSNTKKAD
mmetsp:Transcript_13425/g.16584  ORF Transcript_13425/g.16584 Transcript_13425/m.16584 type:complete len:179 (+) Transcript_13425:205-741(+)